jgi:predicted MPP superfamily phosphohydrolase
MTKPIQPQNFENRKTFPGEDGNTFDVLIHAWEVINHISTPIFLMLLFGLALLVQQNELGKVFILFSFFLTDWLLIRMLPIFKRSFGPANSACLMLAILRLPFNLLPFPINLLAQSIGSVLVIYGFWIEPHRLQLVHQQLYTSKIPSGERIKVLHITDLHVEELTVREYQLLSIIDETQPDIIVFTGDILNLSYIKNEHSLAITLAYMSKWKAPHGVYMVPGSPAVDTHEVLRTSTQQFIDRYLINTTRTIQVNGTPVKLIGLACSHRPHHDYPILKDLLNDHHSELSLLLYHSPDLAPLIDNTVDLYLCGHTHGGQVRLPFFGSLFTASLYGRKLQAGKYQFGNMVLYISRGIGMEGAGSPRVRFLCRPEVTLWEISGNNIEEINNA